MVLKFNWFVSKQTQTMADLFALFSNKETIEKSAPGYSFDEKAKGIIDVLSLGFGSSVNVRYNNEHHVMNAIERTNTVVVAFSGGKDSVSTALKLKGQGKDVRLFYVSGINKSYPDEMKHAKEISSALGLPLHIEYVSQVGKTSFKENPIKNQVIASMALDYALDNNLGCSIAFGDFTSDNISNSQFMESWSDTQEMWNAWVEYVRTYVPNVELIIPFTSYNETLDIISDNKKLLNMVCGCILPYRFRRKTKENNESKYGIKLLNNRCGSCWKCCTEYIFLAEKGVVHLDIPFYIHCLDFLVGKLESVRPDVTVRNRENAYRAFLHREPLEITKKILRHE